MMMSSKVHSQAGNVPFSWEKKPGESKAVAAQTDNHHVPPPKLPPPPCPSRVSVSDIQIPLPPCAFPSRSNSKRGLKKMDDPFLIAYKEVTKSTKKGKALYGGNSNNNSKLGDQAGLGLIKSMSIFSCKQSSPSSHVAENSVVRLSKLPISRSQRDGASN